MIKMLHSFLNFDTYKHAIIDDDDNNSTIVMISKLSYSSSLFAVLNISDLI